MPLEIKNTKAFFLTLRIFFLFFIYFFFLHEAACIVQHSVYNKLVMHIKMSWMKFIQCLLLTLQNKSHD